MNRKMLRTMVAHVPMGHGTKRRSLGKKPVAADTRFGFEYEQPSIASFFYDLGFSEILPGLSLLLYLLIPGLFWPAQQNLNILARSLNKGFS